MDGVGSNINEEGNYKAKENSHTERGCVAIQCSVHSNVVYRNVIKIAVRKYNKYLL